MRRARAPHWVVVVLMLASGCAPQVVTSHPGDLARALAGGQIRAFHSPGADFFIYSGTGLIFALMGQQAGKKLAEEHGLVDPSGRVKERFVEELSQQRGVRHVTLIQDAVPDNGREAVQRLFGDGFVLDFETKVWSLHPPSGFSTDVRILYRGRARLVRVEDWTTLWQATCRVDGTTRAGLSQFTADGAKLLKAELADAAQACSRELLEGFPTSSALLQGHRAHRNATRVIE